MADFLDGEDAGVTDDGNAILGHIFGSKDVSRGVANQAADLTGIGGDIFLFLAGGPACPRISGAKRPGIFIETTRGDQI